jgi:hypothetical protein
MALGSSSPVTPTSWPTTKRQCGRSRCGEDRFWQVPLRLIAASLPLPLPLVGLHRFRIGTSPSAVQQTGRIMPGFRSDAPHPRTSRGARPIRAPTAAPSGSRRCGRGGPHDIDDVVRPTLWVGRGGWWASRHRQCRARGLAEQNGGLCADRAQASRAAGDADRALRDERRAQELGQ